jgi:hypothetical protein
MIDKLAVVGQFGLRVRNTNSPRQRRGRSESEATRHQARGRPIGGERPRRGVRDWVGAQQERRKKWIPASASTHSFDMGGHGGIGVVCEAWDLCGDLFVEAPAWRFDCAHRSPCWGFAGEAFGWAGRTRACDFAGLKSAPRFDTAHRSQVGRLHGGVHSLGLREQGNRFCPGDAQRPPSPTLPSSSLSLRAEGRGIGGGRREGIY